MIKESVFKGVWRIRKDITGTRVRPQILGTVAYFTDLAATSGITLGENARLELPGAPTNWADDAIWQVTLGRKAKLRVGTDSSSLSPEQLKRIRVNGHGAHLDDDGYFLPVSGLLFFVR